MKTSLIQFAKGASPREPYATLTAIHVHNNNVQVSLVNHDSEISLISDDSVEWSGLIEILNPCICVVTWSKESI